MIINKKVTKKEYIKTIFKSDDLHITDENNILFFDIEKMFFTKDILEAVSYIMRYDKFENDKFWNLEINNNMIEFIKPLNSIYILSGGDKFWKNSDIEWSECYDFFEEYFSNNLLIIIKNSKTLKDLKNNLKKSMNLDVFYNHLLFIKIKL